LRLNPASSANLYTLDASASLRRQWQGIEGAPATTQFAVGAPVYIANAGVSLGFERDEIGLQAVNLLRGALAYKVFEKNDLSISAGGAVTYRQASLDGAGLRTSDGTYANGIITHFDDLLPVGDQASTSLGFDAGFEIKWKETRLGVSMLDLNEPISNWSGVDRKWSSTILTYASTLLPVSELLDIEANALLQMSERSMQASINLTAWYRQEKKAKFGLDDEAKNKCYRHVIRCGATNRMRYKAERTTHGGSRETNLEGHQSLWNGIHSVRYVTYRC